MNNKITRFKEILWILAMFGLAAILARIFGGLGATTNLSDSMPWGIWKILNMVAGAALATGGFTMAAVVHIFKIEKYKPLMRPAILIAFLGYASSLFALLWDIGLPHVFYNPFFHWNHHSFLFEVFWCVSLYFTITVIELAPVIFEKYNAKKIIKWLHRISVPVIILGITFSTLHHTSLGSLFLVMPARLHGLWFTGWIPVLFFLSAAGGGMMMVVLVRLCYSYFFNKKENIPVVAGLSKIAAVILSAYFIVKMTDLIYHGNFSLLLSGQWESLVFVFEILLSVIIPVIIIAVPSFRNKTGGLAAASVFAVAGLAMNRIDTGITGLLRTSETAYFPSFPEICLSLGVVAGAGLVFIYLVENFHVFPEMPEKSVPGELVRPKSDRISEMWARGFLSDRARVSLLAVIMFPLAAGIFYSNVSEGISLKNTPVKTPRAVDKTRSVLSINGNLNGDFVTFKHDMHKDKLGGRESCVSCHHLDLPNDNASSCSKCHKDMYYTASIFDHNLHIEKKGGKFSCSECHNPAKPKNLDNSNECAECHIKDMNNFPSEAGKFNFFAPSYTDAMHNKCLACHRDQEKQIKRQGMAECSFCHGEAWKKNISKAGDKKINQ